MTKVLVPLISVFCLLSACTSEQGKLKEQALLAGEARFEEMLVKEADASLSESTLLHQSYIQFMKGTSEVLVTEIKMQGETHAVVTLVMKTYPSSLRQTVLAVASKVDASKARRFNFGEAVSLVAQQKGFSKELQDQPLAVLRFQKSQNGWSQQN